MPILIPAVGIWRRFGEARDVTIDKGGTVGLNPNVGQLRIGMVAACPMPARRGTPLRVERLAQALTARGHAVELMTYHLAAEEGVYSFPVRRIYDRVERGTLPPGPTLAKLALYDPSLARLVARRLAAAPFDIIHAHHYEGLWLRRTGGGG